MKTEDLYVGMRVYVSNPSNERFRDVPGTIIDVGCPGVPSYDCLVEFDENISGHSGLGWGVVEGRYGHCVWLTASQIEEIQDDTTANYSMSYDDLMNGIL